MDTKKAGVAENTRKAPNRLPTIPKIYINSTDKDDLALHCRYNVRLDTNIAAQSLPNLVHVRESPSKAEQPRKSKHGRSKLHTKGEGRHSRSHGSHLSVYCSPRVSRRSVSQTLPKSADVSPQDSDFGWLNAFDPKHLFYHKAEAGRESSNSSADSDDSARSASHLSTCASSDFRFSSFDRLSLPDTSSLSYGKLRRIYSNPGTRPSSKCEQEIEVSLRDSKSCSNLKEHGSQNVNHFELESKLTSDGVNLLSPPPIIPSVFIKSLCDDKGQPKSYEQLYDEAYKKSYTLGGHSRSVKDCRIRQWLQDIQTNAVQDSQVED